MLANDGDDDVRTKNVTSEDESMIQRLSQRHVAAIVATTSALTVIMLIIVVVIFVRQRRCEFSQSVFFFMSLFLRLHLCSIDNNNVSINI